MPIISEGYASTKFQGGTHQEKIEMKANVIEQATVEEIETRY